MKKRFKRSIEDMVELRKKSMIDKIMYVTWKGKLTNKKDLKKFFKRKEIEVIQKREAKIGGDWNIWHQMRALDFGLREVKSDQRVLKTRADVYIQKHYLKKLLSGDLPESNSPSGTEVFEEKVWSPFFVINEPFHICDWCFYGKSEDIRKLVNYDARYDFLYKVEYSLPEVRRFVHPYIKEFRIIEEYLENYDHVNKYEVKNRKACDIRRMKSDTYSKLISLYHKIVLEDFYFGHDAVQLRNRNLLSERAGEVKYDYSFEKNICRIDESKRYRLICSDTEWLKSELLDRKKRSKDFTGGKIRSLIKKPFEFWKKNDVGVEEISYDEKCDKKYYDEESLKIDDNRYYMVYKYLLELLGITDELRKSLRKYLKLGF